MIETIKSYLSIISDWEVIKYDVEGNSFRFLARITLKDSSILVIKEYYFESDSKRKYSYHRMDLDNQLISRWDNAEHWQKISTYPNHEHRNNISNVLPSRIITLQDVFEHISNKIN